LRDRHKSVQHDAQLAVVCIRLRWVKMGYLGDEQQGQQHQAHDCNNPHNAFPRTAPAAKMCLHPCHSLDLNDPFYKRMH
jgi:hypothetical protein